MSLGLSMITNDAEATINILNKYGQYFDIWYITVADKDMKQHQKLLKADIDTSKLKLSYFKWINDFGKARLFNQDKIETDFFFWMDSDDDLENADRIPEIVRYMQANDLDLIQLPYDYAKNEMNESVALQWRERFIRTDSDLKWADVPVHETILAPYARYAQLDWMRVVHNKDEDSVMKSYKRNQKLLEDHYEATKDPRDAFYLGNHYLALKDYEKAIQYYLDHISTSGWDEERYRSWCNVAVCEMKLGLLGKAISASNAAMDERPDWPDAYFIKAMIYDAMEHPEKCVEWAKVGLAKPPPQTSSFLDPTLYQYQGLLQAAIASLKVGQVKQAFQYYTMVLEAAPDNEYVRSLQPLFEETYYDDKAIDYARYLIHYTQQAGGKPQKVFDSLPPRVFSDIRLNAERAKIFPPKEWPERSIVFYCGQTAEAWGPDTLGKGMGGSEEAIVYLSRELLKLGWMVTVFNDREDEYNDDGVQYKPWTLLNPWDTFDVFVAWRNPQMAMGVKARVLAVDLHDVPKSFSRITPQHLKEVNKFFFKSKFHASLAEVPEEQQVIVGNGIKKEQFNA